MDKQRIDLFDGFFEGKTVLVTGHTGFKGSWLCIWLEALGARVIGYALDPYTHQDHFEVAELSRKVIDVRNDVRNKKALEMIVNIYKPEIVFHLAAQPLVRYSYDNPSLTYETNVLGTLNVLETIRLSESIKVGVMITTDKCYENKEQIWSYKEVDTMGGYDPYSGSKACCELMVTSYIRSFFNEEAYKKHGKTIATVRAGNVIGGGDWARDRIIPDCIRKLQSNERITLRNPRAVRPWQFVLEPLYGYMLLARKLWEEGTPYETGWNFGPDEAGIKTVGEVTDLLIKHWGKGNWQHFIQKDKPHESELLSLDCAKAKKYLDWSPTLDLNESIKWTALWYKQPKEGVYELDIKQIGDFCEQVRMLKEKSKRPYKKVSMIMLAYDQLYYTKLAIDSLYEYTPGEDFEFICVNNGSSDGTQEYLEKIPDIKLIHFEKNVGGDRAFNEALKYAEGEYLVFLNNDVVLTKDWLAQLITIMESDPKIGVVVPACNSAPNYQVVPATYNTIRELHEVTKLYNQSNPFRWQERLRLMLYTAIFRTKELKAMGGLDERYSPGGFDDDDLTFRYRRAGYKLIFTTDTYIHHYGGVTIGKEYPTVLTKNRVLFREKLGVDSWDAARIDIEVVNSYDYKQEAGAKMLAIGNSCGSTFLHLKNMFRERAKVPSELTYMSSNPNYLVDLRTICEHVYEGGFQELEVSLGEEKYHIIYLEEPISQEELAIELNKVKTFLADKGDILVITSASIQEVESMHLKLRYEKKLDHRVLSVLTTE